MLADNYDFSGYSKEELIEALETVDDYTYPKNAVEIFSLLESKLRTEKGAIEELYEEEDGMLCNVLELLFFPIFSCQSYNKAEMQEKLIRIRKLVVANET